MNAEQANSLILAMVFLAFAVWGLVLEYSDLIVFERSGMFNRSASSRVTGGPGWRDTWKRTGRIAGWVALMACLYCMWLSTR